MKKNPSCFLVSAIASVILAGCGGGGDSSNPSPSSTATSVSSSSSSSLSSIGSSLAVSSSSSSSVLASVSSSSASSLFVNSSPVFNSAASLSISEGLKSTGYVASATDADNDSLTYSVSGGDDQNQFSIDSATGALSFIATPVFDQPADHNKNNIYTIEISVTDTHGGTTTQIVEITVTDAPRVLTDLSVENAGALLTATVTCDDCQLSATTFEWFLEGNDAPVATGNSYKLLAADQLKKITVKAIPLTTNGASAKPEVTTVSFNKVEKVIFGFGVNAVLKTNGEAVIWGKGEDGEQDYHEVVENVDRIIEPDTDAPRYSIAAIKKDGSLITWGNPEYGGGISNHENALHVKDVTYPKNTWRKSIIALNEDGSVSHFGEYGPNRKNSSVDFDDLKNIRQLINGTQRTPMYGSEDLYVIDGNGDVKSFCWTALHYCADVSDVGLNDVEKIQSAGYLFTALKNDGSLVSWGIDNRLYPNGSPFENVAMKSLPDNSFVGEVTQLIAGGNAFAALLSNNEVITWGDPRNGGNPTGIVLADVDTLYSNHSSFAAKKHDGTLVIWRETGKVVADNVKTLVANNGSYAAIKMDGTVGYWDSNGEDRYENLISYEYDDDYNVIGSEMPPLAGVKEIIAGSSSFSALKEDGTVYSWKYYGDGSDSGFTNIVKVFKPQSDTYAGLDANGNLRIWGELDSVGDLPEEDLVSTLIELSSTIN